jgi:hypothetical protein
VVNWRKDKGKRRSWKKRGKKGEKGKLREKENGIRDGRSCWRKN